MRLRQRAFNTPEGRTGRTDEGTVLIFVMVLIVIAGLVVIPLMQYTGTVLRANRVVSEQTKQAEAAKGGLRVALADPKRIFNDCNNSTTLASTDINGYNVSTTCTELEETGPAIALGFQVPAGAVAAQVGHEVRDTFSGGTLDSGPVPPYPATVDWWTGQESTLPETGKMWLPHLPTWPSAVRDSTPLDMPSGFDCKVFLPGNYADPITLTTGNVYFASGVYYFADTVTVSGDADVIVGYGLSDLGTDCADDLQVAANIIGDIGSGFGISGGGATWVFGENGRLLVDDSAGGSPSLVFNQRYDSIDRGGRINIITVNGDERTGVAHDVPDVNLIPRSLVQEDPDELVPPIPISPGTYEPSSIDLTDAARPPLTPQGVTVDGYTYDDSGSVRAMIVVSWDEVIGQSTGGAVIDQYDVTLSSNPVCDTNDVTVTPGATPADPVRFTCVIADVGFGPNTVELSAKNIEGNSLPSISTITVSSTAPLLPTPDAPANVVAVDAAVDNVAQVSWDPAVSAIPVTGYRVDATEISIVPHPNEAPVAPPSGAEVVQLEQPIVSGPDSEVRAQLRAFDPNGDDLTLTIDTSLLPPGLTATFDDVTDTVTVRAQAPALPLLVPEQHRIPYTVMDPSGLTAPGELLVNLLVPGTLVNEAPVADALTLFADVGAPITSRVPVSDIDGIPDPSLWTVAVDLTPTADFPDPSLWTVGVGGLDVSITTTAPDGVYRIPYTVGDALGTTTPSEIIVTVARTHTNVGSCSVTPTPGAALPTSCDLTLPGDIVPAPDPALGLGYRFDVVATNDVGDSPIGMSPAPYATAFDGTGTVIVAPLPFQRTVVPWIPDPVIEILASDAGATLIEVPGYVSVPMSRIVVDNPGSDAISLSGGTLAGTYDVTDGREVPAAADSVPIGFRNDIVLQRKVRIISTAGTSKSVAIVQVNEDGAAYAVNEWSIS